MSIRYSRRQVLVVVCGLAFMGSAIGWRPQSSSAVWAAESAPPAPALRDGCAALLIARTKETREKFIAAANQTNFGLLKGELRRAGDVSLIDLDAFCIPNLSVASGRSVDANALDRAGPALRIEFARHTAGKFSGMQAVVTGPVTYDLTGSAELVLEWAVPGTKSLRVEFQVNGASSGFRTLTPAGRFQTMRIPVTNFVGLNLKNISRLVEVWANDVNTPNGGVLLLRSVRFEPVPISQRQVLGFPQSFECFGVQYVSTDPLPLDNVLSGFSSIYDAAITALALDRLGTPEALAASKLIMDSLVYAIDHDQADPRGIPGTGGIVDATMPGRLDFVNSQPGGALKGEVRYAGFTAGPSGNLFYLVETGASTGNQSIVGLCLIRGWYRYGDIRFLNAARGIGEFLIAHMKKQTGHKGFSNGYESVTHALNPGSSTEGNADCVSLCCALARAERRAVPGAAGAAAAARWQQQADHALAFVLAMYLPAEKRFAAGTVPDGTAAGPGIRLGSDTPRDGERLNIYPFMDAATFSFLAISGTKAGRNVNIDWPGVLADAKHRFAKRITASGRVFEGYGLIERPDPDQYHPEASVDGAAFEFTAQLYLSEWWSSRLQGSATNSAEFVRGFKNLETAQLYAPFGDRKGLVCCVLQGLDELGSIPPREQGLTQPFSTLPPRVALNASSFALLVALAAESRTANFFAADQGPSISIPTVIQPFAQHRTRIIGGTPGGLVYLYRGTGPGTTTIGAVQLDIANAVKIGSATMDSLGMANIDFPITPMEISKTLKYQAIDIGLGETSNVTDYRFP